jgi:hypothetical protein
MLIALQGGCERILNRLGCATDRPLPYLLLQQRLHHWVHKALRPRERTWKAMGFQHAFSCRCQAAVYKSARRGWMGIGSVQESGEVGW